MQCSAFPRRPPSNTAPCFLDTLAPSRQRERRPLAGNALACSPASEPATLSAELPERCQIDFWLARVEHRTDTRHLYPLVQHRAGYADCLAAIFNDPHPGRATLEKRDVPGMAGAFGPSRRAGTRPSHARPSVLRGMH